METVADQKTYDVASRRPQRIHDKLAWEAKLRRAGIRPATRSLEGRERQRVDFRPWWARLLRRPH